MENGIKIFGNFIISLIILCTEQKTKLYINNLKNEHASYIKNIIITNRRDLKGLLNLIWKLFKSNPKDESINKIGIRTENKKNEFYNITIYYELWETRKK